MFQAKTKLRNWLYGDMIQYQIRDYFDVTSALIWQRQAIFLAATILTAFYFDPLKSFACYGAILLTEAIDLYLARQVKNWTGAEPRQVRRFVTLILINTFLSATAICVFVTSTALQQPIGDHFMPLFFLFAAALFAAMNNHQMLPALILRLVIYGITFFLVVLLDIWRVMPPLSSVLWLQFFTVIFVMYFIVDCSFVYLRMYRNNLSQLKELRVEHEKTKAAYLAKSQFVSTVSHELRTPLTSIKCALDLLNLGALGPVPKAMASTLSIAGTNSKRLADLINDLLDIQKMEAGEMTYRFEPLDVRQLVHDAVEANRDYADSLGITVQCDGAEQDSAYINGDESRLMQVMSNIISNALKFSHSGGVVRVYYSDMGQKVRISVEDKGVGIPDNSTDKVFDRFTQIDSSDQRRFGGSGLGMNISKQIVEQHNGEIGYVSELGQGTTFFVDLDIYEPVADAA